MPHGQRCACQVQSTRARNRRHDANRPTARQRGYDGRWERARLEFLQAHPNCAMCGQKATLVDHMDRHQGNQEIFWDWRRWQSLCTHCHSSRKQRLERQQTPAGTV